ALVGRFTHLGGGKLVQVHWALLLLPAVGGLISGVLAGIFCEPDPGGTESVVRSFHHEGGRLPLKPATLKALANVGVISCGGSAGPEGPVAALGAGIGSAFAGWIGMPARERRLFLLAGCAAGVSAIFQSPLGGALFATTIPYHEPENEDEALMPSIVASVFGYAAFMGFWGYGHPLLSGTETLAFTRPIELLAYALLGVLCAGAGAMLWGSFALVRACGLDRRFKRWQRPVVGGIIVGAIACLVPQVMDAQYRFCQNALLKTLAPARSWAAWAGLFAVVAVAKSVATAFTVGTENTGGTLGPSVFIGGTVGAFTGAALEALFPGVFPEELRRALIPVGMAGMLSVTARVPLAAAVMVLEITGSYGLIVPLMLVTVLGYVLGRRWGLNHEQVGSPADSPAHAGRGIVNVLETLLVGDLAEREWPHVVGPDTPVAELARLAPGEVLIVVHKRRVLGVIRSAELALGRLEGPATAAGIMLPWTESIRPDDGLMSSLPIFHERALDAIPVTDRRGRFRGVLRRAAIYGALRDRTAEQRRLFLEEQAALAALDQEGQLEEILAGLGLEGRILVERIGVPAGLRDRTLRGCNFRREYGYAVLAIQSADGALHVPPDPDRPLAASDLLVVIHDDQVAAAATPSRPAAVAVVTQGAGSGGAAARGGEA
ncbi:MAG TPA: chloride channel protein, partial [Planctomycetota bacterium]|nr:chloride channel protein [Planctomycetota bacterium]